MRPFAKDPLSSPVEELAARAMTDAGASRPVLLRVIADLFAMRTGHTADEIRQFEEISLRLIETAQDSDLLHVAEALVRHDEAPSDVVDLIAVRGGPAACLLLAQCRRLSTLSIDTAASIGSSDQAAAVAARPDLDSAQVRLLASRPELDIARALAANPGAPLERDSLAHLIVKGRIDAEIAQALFRRMPTQPALAALFLGLTSRQRDVVVSNVKRSLEGDATLSTFMDAPTSAARRIEAAVLSQDREALVDALSQGCGCGRDLTAAILADEGGEPLAIALRACGVEATVATRVFLFVDPAMSQSYGKISKLAMLAASTSMDVARMIVNAMAAAPAERTRRAHVPYFDSTAKPLAERLRAGRPFATIIREDDGRGTGKTPRPFARQA